MKEQPKKKSGRYIYFCSECKHEWFSKQMEYVCPECKSTILEEEAV